jgi:hypothetical protein
VSIEKASCHRCVGSKKKREHRFFHLRAAPGKGFWYWCKRRPTRRQESLRERQNPHIEARVGKTVLYCTLTCIAPSAR